MGFLHVLESLLAGDLRTMTPILLAAIGLVYMERSGIVNIGAEGMMLVGSLGGVVGSYYLHSAAAGMLVASVSAGFVGLLFAYLVVTLRADQVVTGAAVNILALGLTTTFARIIFGLNTAPPSIAGYEPVVIPWLSRIPVLGPALFSQTAPVYLALLLVPLAHFLLFRTTIGLRVRAVGEYPRAADTVGIDVFKVRYATIIGGSMLAGIAGSYLSLGTLNFFTENMTAGRGFIALAAVIFGKYTPFGSLGAALIFGLAQAVQSHLQALNSPVPYQFILMLPYVATVAALAGLVGRVRPPASSGQPYSKE